MKKAWSRLGSLVVLFAAIIFSILPLTFARSSAGDSSKASQKSPKKSTLNERIARIEKGLLPPVLVKDQPVPTMTMTERMKFYHVPGVSIAFFEKEKIIWTRAYGFADVTAQRPVTPETLFQAGSISKPVSALAAMKLVQEGKLNLDKNVNEELHSWKVPENKFTTEQKVTLRRILSHTAGLTVSGFHGYAAGDPVPTVVQILNGEPPANTPPVRVNVVPGAVWHYSGGGYVVMQQLLMDVTRKPFPQILHDLVLQPAGMTHSAYDQPLPQNLTSSAAVPYLANGEPVKGGAHTYPEMAPAGLWTTPSDLARLAIEVQKEYAGKSSKILSKATTQEMLARQKDNWGLGFVIEDPGHQLHFGHGGSNVGFESDLEAYTDSESQQGVAIMTNGYQGDELNAEILRAIAKEYNWPDFQPKEHVVAAIDPKLFDGYVGQYQLKLGNALLTVTRDGEHLFMQRNDRRNHEIFAESNRDFFEKTDDTQYTFVTDSQGRATELILHVNEPNGVVDQHAKHAENREITSSPALPQAIHLSPEVMQRFTGKYQPIPPPNAPAGIDLPAIEVTANQDGLLINSGNGETRQFLPLSEGEFFLQQQSNIHITFTKDDQGRITGFTITGYPLFQKATKLP